MRFPFFGRRSPAGSLEDALRELRSAAFFSPTPFAVARAMLEFADAGPEDVVYDLGCGDGRIPIMAAQEFGCRAVGIDLDPKLCAHATAKAQEYGLAERVSFRQQDFFQADVRPATIVTLYLLTAVNGHLGPRLASQLGKGTRVVTLDYPVPGWREEQTKDVRSEGDVEYQLFLYRR